MLGEWDISEKDAESMTETIMKNPVKLDAVPVEITEDDVRDIIEYMR